MPSIRQSQQVNMDGWTQNTAETPRTSAPLPESDPQAKSPFMHAAMPLMASTGDAFARQFYGGGNLPSFRTLPFKRGGGA